MTAEWSVVGASVAGSKHHREGQPCEDAWEVISLGGLTVCAVADGAGSAPRAAEGARIAVSSVRAATLRWGPEPSSDLAALVEAALKAGATALVEEATRARQPVASYHTTLTVCAMKDDDIAVAQIGDCLAILHRQRSYEVVAYPESERRFVEETEFLNWERARAASATSVTIPMDEAPIEFALCTDGLAPLLLDRWVPPTPHDPFFDSLFRAVHDDRASQAELEDFLRSPEVCQRTDDDKTLVLARRIA